MNPMLQLINSSPVSQGTQTAQTTADNSISQIVEQAKPLYNMFKSASNPTELMQQMCLQNPAVKQAYDTAHMLAGNDVNAAKAAFYANAKRAGIDPDAFIAQLKG